MLCAKFLYNTDERIENAQNDETVIAYAVFIERREKGKYNGHHEKYEVKERKSIVEDYPADAFGTDGLFAVDLPFLNALGHLGRSKAAFRNILRNPCFRVFCHHKSHCKKNK